MNADGEGSGGGNHGEHGGTEGSLERREFAALPCGNHGKFPPS